MVCDTGKALGAGWLSASFLSCAPQAPQTSTAGEEGSFSPFAGLLEPHKMGQKTSLLGSSSLWGRRSTRVLCSGAVKDNRLHESPGSARGQAREAARVSPARRW